MNTDAECDRHCTCYRPPKHDETRLAALVALGLILFGWSGWLVAGAAEPGPARWLYLGASTGATVIMLVLLWVAVARDRRTQRQHKAAMRIGES